MLVIMAMEVFFCIPDAFLLSLCIHHFLRSNIGRVASPYLLKIEFTCYTLECFKVTFLIIVVLLQFLL